MNWLLALVLAGAVALIAYRMRLLTWDGALSATGVGASLFGIGGMTASVPLLVFFFTSSLLPKALGRAGKGERRNWLQVIANGGIPMLCAWLVVLMPERAETAWLAYTASLACATGDTWATEIGIRFGRQPRLITTGQPVPPGTSGGVTFAGTLGGLTGAGLLSTIAMAVFGFEAWQGALCFGVGLSGVVLDSLLGATLQAKYRCEHCGKTVETLYHCQTQVSLIHGLRWLDNNGVNLLSTAWAGVAGWVLSGVLS